MKLLVTLFWVAATRAVEDACEDDGVVETMVGDEKSQKDYYEKASHYGTSAAVAHAL